MKEAGRTSVLSKRWRHVWAHIRYLNFDACDEEEHMYCSWVDQVVSLHKAPAIDEFKVEYDFQVGREENIDKWLRFAVEKRVKKLELDVVPFGGANNSITYTFPSLPFRNSLTNLDLHWVDVSGEVIEKLLSDCLNLECLTIEGSESLVDLKVAGSSLNLKSLRILTCFGIQQLEISAPNLELFHYSGPQIISPFKSVPKLAELIIGGYYANHLLSNFLDILMVISHIEVLTIKPVHQIKNIVKVFPIFKMVKTLDITVDPYSDVQLFHLRFLLKACPSLHKFVLKFTVADFEVELTEETRNLQVCPHNQLKVLVIDEFVGWEVDTAFVKYLIESAASLEKLVIRPTDIITDWEPCLEQRRTRAIKQAKLLQSYLKPSTVFQIICD